jgi:nickel/cobalt transporter (NiCoT) family protein
MTAVAILGLALGMRHGTDPDHLAAIDGLTRIRARAMNGVYFALGHGVVVILLAVGIGHLLSERFAFLGPWTLMLIGALNLLRLLRPHHEPTGNQLPIVAQPVLLGMLLAAGFETSSQLSALILAGQTNPWLLGAAFAGGMVVVDGLDGVLASSTQRLAWAGSRAAKTASRALGIMVVIFAFGLGSAELSGIELNRIAFPLGLTMFAVVVVIRSWARFAGSRTSTGWLAIEKAVVDTHKISEAGDFHD